MKTNQAFYRRSMHTGYFFLLAVLLMLKPILAFHKSAITPFTRNYHTVVRSRGMDHGRESLVFNNIRSNDAHKHVLRDFYRPQDNLFSGIAEIGMGFSIGVLYSEYFIIMTGCGPPNFGDALERICYQGVIVYAGLALFNRIVTQFSSGLEDTVDNMFGPLQPSTLWQVRIAEYLSAAAVLGAFVALQVQFASGASMDGLSGIDVNMCRAIRGDM